MEELLDAQVDLNVENTGWGAFVLAELDMMREKGQQCDISISSPDGSLVQAHSLVLSAGSAFFKQVLEKARSSASVTITTSVVIKCSFSRDIISLVCDFLYRGRTLPPLSQISEVHRAAKTFGIIPLVTLCQVFADQNTLEVSGIAEQVTSNGQKTDLDSVIGIQPEQQLPASNKGNAGDNADHNTNHNTDHNAPTTDDEDDDGPLELDHDINPNEAFETNLAAAALSTDLMDLTSLHALDHTEKVPSSSPSKPRVPKSNIKANVTINYDGSTVRKVYRYNCDLCERVFNSRCRLEGHRATHSGERLHKCDVCGAGFVQSEYLREHKTMHTGLKPWKCPYCDMTFRDKRSMKIHTRKHFPRKKFTCSICNRVLHRSDAFKNHMRTHTGEKPYKCRVCDRFFSTRDNRRMHMFVHTNERPYKCNVCNKTFRRNDALRTHKKIHSAVRPFVCEHEGCNAGFRLTKQLQKHIRVFHTPQKPPKPPKKPKEVSSKKRVSKEKPPPTLKEEAQPEPPKQQFYHCKSEGCSSVFRLDKQLQKHYRLFHPHLQEVRVPKRPRKKRKCSNTASVSSNKEAESTDQNVDIGNAGTSVLCDGPIDGIVESHIDGVVETQIDNVVDAADSSEISPGTNTDGAGQITNLKIVYPSTQNIVPIK